ncbi:hypothetical protein Vafri_19433 [Volvox africanus]|uniref:UBX domain-containing protein n=1 Tax=Volvox africanus TaxID=51714 RepID=A0A8J4F8P1_9CHLO|nr:hypothetical protein Vafri_19433 [Volvox africanus]
MSPETRSLIIAFSFLFIAYIAVHWKYFYSDFYLDVWQSVDPRRQTILPQSVWGFLVRGIICYYAFKCYKWLYQEWQKRADARRAVRVAVANDGARIALAEELQKSTSEAAAAVQAVERQRRQAQQAAALEESSGTGTLAAAQEEAGGERGAGKLAWLEKLQAKQDEAAAAALQAAKAAAAVAAAAAAAAAATAATAAPAGTATVTAATVATVAAEPLPAVRQSSTSATATSSSAVSTSGLIGGGSTATRSTATSGAAAGGTSSSTATAAVNRGLNSGGSSMVSLQDAQEAEQRQRQWLQQLSVNPSLSPLKVEAMERERALKAEQDTEYEAALEADRRRATEVAEAEAAAAAAAAARAEAEAAAAVAEAERRSQLAVLRQQLAESLPAEPDRDDETAVLVRVRLPDGCSYTRRFAGEAPVQQIRDWLQSLESFPLWEPAGWSLVNSYPRRVLGAEGDTVASVSSGAKQVALFVQEI